MCVPRTIYEFDNFPAVRNSENVEKRLPVDCHAAVRTCSIGAFYHLCGNGTGSSCPTNVSLLYFSIPDTSTAIYVITSHKKELSWRVFVAMEAADITVCTVLISLSSGTNMKLWVDRPLSGPAAATPRFKWKFHHEPTASTASTASR